jgi:hypothetical protein
MGMYRKKPIVIEAYKFLGGERLGRDLAFWCGGRYRYEEKASDPTDVAEWIDIPTLEGVMRAGKGDWIIRGVAGEFYPCKPDIFDATFDAVEAQL